MLRTVGNRSLIGSTARRMMWVAVLALLLAGGIQAHAIDKNANHTHALNAQHGTPVERHPHLHDGVQFLPVADLFVHCGADLLALAGSAVIAKFNGVGSERPARNHIWAQIDQGHDPPPPRFLS